LQRDPTAVSELNSTYPGLLHADAVSERSLRQLVEPPAGADALAEGDRNCLTRRAASRISAVGRCLHDVDSDIPSSLTSGA